MGVKVRKKDGAWWLFIHHEGRRAAQKVGRSKAIAEQMARRVEAELAENSLNLAERRTRSFRHFCEIWLNDFMVESVAASTADSQERVWRNHVKTWSCYGVPVDKITVNDLEKLFIEKRKVLKYDSVRHIKDIISHAFKRAVKDGALAANPCRDAQIPPPRAGENFEAKPYSAAEIDALLAAFAGTHHYPLVLFLCRTGVRFSEAAGLEWDSVDLDKRQAVIRQVFVKGKFSRATKNKQHRTIDLTPALVKELRRHKLATQGTGPLVFKSPGGAPVDISNFRVRHFSTAAKRAGLHHTRIHDLRHSVASILVQETKDIFYASRQLGHSSIKITADRYGHLLNRNEETRQIDVLDQKNG